MLSGHLGSESRALSWLATFLVLTCSLAIAKGQSLYSTSFTPIVVPLAVRGPYLGAYLQGRQHKNLAEMSPRFWTGAPLGWSGLLRVDGEVWNWMGNITSWQAATNQSFSSDSSTSTFVMTNGGEDSATVALTASFFSPITPTDLFRQSLPFSYLSLSVVSLDEEPHDVEVYTDVNGLWASNNEDEILDWAERGEAGWLGSRFRLADQRLFQEESDRILHGDVWYASRITEGIEATFSTGFDAQDTRRWFAENGVLDGNVNMTSRATRRRAEDGTILDEPVFAFAHSFGSVTGQSPMALLAIGHVRDPIAQYMTADDTLKLLHPLWGSSFAAVGELVSFFLSDYETVKELSEEWNFKLYDDARRVHSDSYADILAIATRQIFMAMESVWEPPSTSTEHSRFRPIPMTMLKEISSNGNCQTVDVIAPTMPFLAYASPALFTSLLEPIYRYVATGQYRPVPPPHDLGAHYPNATGRNHYVDSDLPLEEAGNMLNLAAVSLQLGTEGKEQAERYYPLLKQWAGYLQENCLYPGNQRSTDDFFAKEANQTSLALKGILGLRSMAEIAGALGHKVDQKHFLNISATYRDTFLDLAVSTDSTHLLGAYSNQSSWVTQYNLFYDALLGFNMFPQWVTDMQDSWYIEHDEGLGPALDSRDPTRAKIDWMLWTAASSSLQFTRDMFVNGVSAYFHHDANEVFGDLITPDEGWSVGFLDRPVVGGLYSMLALDYMTSKRDATAWYVPTLPTLDDVKEGISIVKGKVKEHTTTRPLLSLVVLVILFIIILTIIVRFSRRVRAGRSASTAKYTQLREVVELPSLPTEER